MRTMHLHLEALLGENAYIPFRISYSRKCIHAKSARVATQRSYEYEHSPASIRPSCSVSVNASLQEYRVKKSQHICGGQQEINRLISQSFYDGKILNENVV